MRVSRVRPGEGGGAGREGTFEDRVIEVGCGGLVAGGRGIGLLKDRNQSEGRERGG